MNIALYQILIPLVAAFFIVKAFSHFARSEKTLRELIAIFIFWSTISFFAIMPEVFVQVSKFLGFANYVNGILFISLALLFYICYKLILAQDKTERELTRLVRKLALEEVTGPKSKVKGRKPA